MKLKELRELINGYPANDDDTEFELYNGAGEVITNPVDIHEDITDPTPYEPEEYKILIFG